MDNVWMLYGSAATVAVIHTALGPDHYLPFIAMSRAGAWTPRRTLVTTALCGVGHVLGSVVLGTTGIALGLAVFQMEGLEATRGSIAGWLLIAFGLAYFAWGVVRVVRNRPHAHLHVHADGTVHTHHHTHESDHLHVHPEPRASARAPAGATGCSQPVPAVQPGAYAPGASPSRLTPWFLFTVFLFGPCEPLIPLLMFPIAQGRPWHALGVTIVFGVLTIGTMLTAVFLATTFVWPLHAARWERFSHAAAGVVLVACGAAVKLGF